MEFEKYLQEWKNGIPSEIKFWDKLMATKGASVNGEKLFARRCDPNAPFILEDELESGHTDFLDIGSGPFSNCGVLTKKSELDFMAVDPLAYAYEKLKSKHEIVSPISPKTGMLEFIDYIFDNDYFDIVHMSNSLDHTFDPILGIAKMINITKTGGKIILRHCENEAERANYRGLHQWNICVDANGHMIVWRPNEYIDICEKFAEYVTVEKCEIRDTKELDSTWTHNYVVLRKKKSVEINDSKDVGNLIKTLLDAISDFYSE